MIRRLRKIIIGLTVTGLAFSAGLSVAATVKPPAEHAVQDGATRLLVRRRG